MAAAAVMERHVLPHLPPDNNGAPKRESSGEPWPQHLARLVFVFSTGTLAAMALTTLLIPLMVERGTPPGVAAVILAGLGLAQLPGRIWLLRGHQTANIRALNTGPIYLQATGLFIVVASHAAGWVAIGVLTFGLGAGLHTLARPWMIQSLYGTARAARWNGEVARSQGFARATGPVLAAAASQWMGSAAVLAAAGGLLALTIISARTIPIPPHLIQDS